MANSDVNKKVGSVGPPSVYVEDAVLKVGNGREWLLRSQIAGLSMRGDDAH